MKRRQAVSYIAKKLADAEVSEPEAKAKVIISESLETGYTEIYSYTEISDKDMARIEETTQRCLSGEPVEYVTGKAYFRHIELYVNPDVLIPRKETELVAGAAIELIRMNSYLTALDIGTGSGCIAVSIAAETVAFVTASDISEQALATARKNAAKNGTREVKFIISDMFAEIEGFFDIIVSNPPYISESEYSTLDKSVKKYEPKIALIAGDGLKFYRIIAAEARNHINPGGAIVLETGCDQAEAVSALLMDNGFTGIECIRDYEGRMRIIRAFSG